MRCYLNPAHVPLEKILKAGSKTVNTYSVQGVWLGIGFCPVDSYDIAYKYVEDRGKHKKIVFDQPVSVMKKPDFFF